MYFVICPMSLCIKKLTKKLLFFSDEIKIDSPDQPGKAQIIAFSVWGILRGMESFGQLIYFTTFDGANEPSVSWIVNRGNSGFGKLLK